MGPRHIVITGASGGIGQALAVSYARQGVVLGLVGRDQARLEACAKACRSLGAQVVVGVVDLRDAATTRSWIEAFDDRHSIDLLIANAGVASTLSMEGEWEGIERTKWVVDTNLIGVMHTVEPAIARMRARRAGQIGIVSSLAALRGMAISPAYCASKAALKAWGDSVRPILARDGIRVSMILPGFVRTPMSDVFPGDKLFMWSPEKAARVIQRRLSAGHVQILFPAILSFGMRLLALLPTALADAILARLYPYRTGGR